MNFKALKNFRGFQGLVLPDLVTNRLLRYYLLLQRFWWILVVSVVCGILWELYSIQSKPDEYISKARMIVSARLMLENQANYSEELSNFFGTQLEIMQSPQVLEKAQVRAHKLNENIQSQAYLNVEQIPKTNIFLLQAKGYDPVYTANYLNAVMEEFINLKRNIRQETSVETISQITDELSRLRIEQSDQEDALFNFNKKYNINFWEHQTTESARYLTELKNKEASLQTQLRYLEGLNIDTSAETTSSKDLNASTDLILSLNMGIGAVGNNEFALPKGFETEYVEGKKQLLKYKLELEELSQNLKSNHPKIVILQDKIKRQQNYLIRSSYQNLKTAKASVDSIESQIGILSSVIKEWETKLLQSSQIQAEHDHLKANVERTKSMYSNLTDVLKKLEVGQNINLETIQVLEKALPPVLASKEFFKNLFKSICLSVLAGSALLILIDILDNRIVSSVDIESRFHEPVLTQIPHLGLEDIAKGTLLTVKDGRTHYLEAFRHLRSSLIFNQTQDATKLILITGNIPGEGKTTIAANLAITFAQSGERVLLIDGDLRVGNLTRIFNFKKKPGLLDILENQKSWKDCMYTTDHANVTMIPRGTSRSEVGNVFLLPTLDIFLKEIRGSFDRILIDSAPLLAVTDTACLAPKADGAIMVIRSGHVSSSALKQACHALQSRQGHIIGFVLNDLRLFPGYHYYDYKHYHKTTF